MLLAELGRRGYAVVHEPGRRIVKEELKSNGSALPWMDQTAFARRVIMMALADHESAGTLKGWVFFDRSLVDAAAGLQHVTGERALAALGQSHRYHRRVFLTPPWLEIYVTDPERRHGVGAALAEYPRLLEAYAFLDYEVFVVPKVGVVERADFILNALTEPPERLASSHEPRFGRCPRLICLPQIAEPLPHGHG
jgi:predicted ATPase